MLGISPLGITLSSSGSAATTANTDGTVNTFSLTTQLQTKLIQSSTLVQPAQPVNLLSTTAYLFITLPNVPAIAVLSVASGVYHLTQQLPVAASPINLAGNSSLPPASTPSPRTTGRSRSRLAIVKTRNR